MIIELIIGGIFGFMLATIIKEDKPRETQQIYYFIEKDKYRTNAIIEIKNNE